VVAVGAGVGVGVGASVGADVGAGVGPGTEIEPAGEPREPKVSDWNAAHVAFAVQHAALLVASVAVLFFHMSWAASETQ